MRRNISPKSLRVGGFCFCFLLNLKLIQQQLNIFVENVDDCRMFCGRLR